MLRLVGFLVSLLGCTQVYGQQAAEETSQLVLEEIIVTAQKREQNIAQVPFAVSALNAESISNAHMETAVKLTDLHPSVTFDTAQSFQRSSLKIRGIGTIGNSRSFEGAVGVFVDGAYRPRSGMVLTDLLDIDRIEVLRGPQSTLYGKNTVAGAVALYSTRPVLDELAGDLELQAGNLDFASIKASVNAPLSDSVAIRIAGITKERDGSFVSPDTGDSYDSVDRYGFKAQLLFQPRDDFAFHLVADLGKSDAHCCWGSAIAFNGPTNPLIEAYSALNGLSFAQAPDAESTRAQSLNTLPGEVIEDFGVVATLDWNVSGASVKSVTSVRDWDHSQIVADADFVGADLFTLSEPAQIRAVSQEFSVALPFRQRDDILVGFYVAEEDYSSTRHVQTGSDADAYLNALISAAQGSVACLPPLFDLDCVFPAGIGALLDDGELTAERYFQDSQTLAVFAHATFALADRLELVAGLRYSEEDKDGGVENSFWYDSAIVRGALELIGVPDDGTPRNGLDLTGTVYSPSFTDSTREDELTGTASLKYVHSDSLVFFGGYHRGYKAGGINLFREGVVTAATTYRPEFAESYEIGLKASYWQGRAATNLSIFDAEFTDLQINFFTGLDFRTENTGRSRSRGLELENRFQVTDALGIEVSATILDAEFERIDNPLISYLVGRETPRSPDLASVLTFTYEKPITGNLEFFGRAMLSYTGSHFVGTEIAVEEKVGSYSIFDTSVGISSTSGNWDLILWCANCRDRDYRTIYFNTTFQPGTFSSYLNEPRRYGLTLRARF